MRNDHDIIIIGAGAAGLAAGRRLRAAQGGAADGADFSFVILEARDRIGGRAHTIDAGGFAVDLGAGWLHAADRNMWRAAALEAGIALDATSAPWERRAQADAGQRALGAAFARFSARIEAGAGAPDRPASDYLEPDAPANATIEAVCTYLNGVTLDRVSAHDYVRYDGEGANHRLPGGYGALLTQLGAALPIARATRARLIDHRGARIRVDTDQGALTARAVIVATPTPMIATAALRLDPPLPEIVDAASALPLGVVNKIFVGFEDGAVPPGEGNMFGGTRSIAHASYDVRPLGRPLIEAFLAGPLAEDLERAGPAAANAFVLDELAGFLGRGARARLIPMAASAWARDPLAGGAYSYARPGGAGARAVLAAPATPRLFFAGEAAAPAFFGTAHGAGETGEIAAERALAALSPRAS